MDCSRSFTSKYETSELKNSLSKRPYVLLLLPFVGKVKCVRVSHTVYTPGGLRNNQTCFWERLNSLNALMCTIG